MTDLAALLGYFAQLAPAGRGPEWDRVPSLRDLTLLGWRSIVPVFGDHLDGGSARPQPPLTGTPRVDRLAGASGFAALASQRTLAGFDIEKASSDLDRLISIDRLHASEHLLRVGWLFLAGDVELDGSPTRVFLPLGSAPVSVEETGRNRYRMVLETELGLPRRLLDDGTRDRLESRLESVVGAVFGSGAPSRTVEITPGPVGDWVTAVTRALGLPKAALVGPGENPTSRPELLTCFTGMAVYTARDVDAPNVADTLKNAAAVTLRGTAVEVLYEPIPTDSDIEPVAEDVDIVSPMPLNEAQARIMSRARHDAITVVSGPPGTGKSHLAAALAIDQVRLGNSVLIAAQSEHAVDAIHELLERFPAPRYVRFGSRRHREAVADGLASGMANPTSPGDVRRARERHEEAVEMLREIEMDVARGLESERAFDAALRERQRLSWTIADVPLVGGGMQIDRARAWLQSYRSRHLLFDALRRRRARTKLCRLLGASGSVTDETLEKAIAYSEADATVARILSIGGITLAEAFDQLAEARLAVRSRLGERIDNTARSEGGRQAHQAVGALATALRSGAASRRRMLRELDGEHLVDVLPMWLGTLTDIDDTLPLVPGMFDVVIFDEASQINQIRSVAGLMRAKRLVVMGDPRQLRHVSFVSDESMRAAAAAHGVDGGLAVVADVRRNSLYDAAVAGAPVTMLTEHFRSVPHIIGFSDRRFYGGALRLMTQHPSNETRDAIRPVSAAGRRKDGINRAELETVRTLVRSAVDEGHQSIGVLSPFRAQADAIEAVLLDELTADEIAAAGVRVGTVHGFQGAERDLTIISLALGADELGQTLRFVEDPGLFNVMVTRARDQIVLVHSVDPVSVPEGLLRDYFRHADQPPAPSRTAEPAGGWLAELAARISAFGLRVVADYDVAGHTVDLAVGEGPEALGVECAVHRDGAPAHIERHLVLRRAGWDLVDAFESRWLAQPESAVEAIVEDVLRRSRLQTTRGAGQ